MNKTALTNPAKASSLAKQLRPDCEKKSIKAIRKSPAQDDVIFSIGNMDGGVTRLPPIEGTFATPEGTIMMENGVFYPFGKGQQGVIKKITKGIDG